MVSSLPSVVRSPGRSAFRPASLPALLLAAVLLLALWSSNAQAASSYLYSFQVARHLAGIRLYPPPDSTRLFMGVRRQPFWAGDGTVVSTWEGGGMTMRRSLSLGDAAVLCATSLSGTSFVVVQVRGQAVQCVEFDTTLSVVRSAPLPVEAPIGQSGESRIVRLSEKRFLVLVQGTLVLCTISRSALSCEPVAFSVRDVCPLLSPERSIRGYAYAARSQRGTEIVFCDTLGSLRATSTLQAQETVRIQSLDDKAVALIEELAASSAVTVVETDGAQTRFFLPSRYETVSIRRSGTASYIASHVVDDRSGLHLHRGMVRRGTAAYTLDNSIALSDFFIDPLLLQNVGETDYIVFQNGLTAVAGDGEVLAAERLNFRINEEGRPELFDIAGGLLLAHPAGSFVLGREEHSFWWFNRLAESFLTLFLVVFAVSIIVVMWRIIYRQRRLLTTLFETPDAEPMLILDPEGRLVRLNDSARTLLRISRGVPMHRMLHSYIAGTTGLQELADEAISFRQRFSRRVEIPVNGGADEFVFTATPVLSIFRRMRWVYMTGRNITRELERKRIANWAQLAHDMQTNLSIIRLNTEKIIAAPDDGATDRGRKILFQVNLLINRVRDLVTVGRQDVLHIEQVDAADLCASVCEEFDPSFFPNVLFRIETQTAVITCDRMKMERALRNAVENAIRALQGKSGTVDISSWKDEHMVYFQVRDSGVGMDRQTQENMMKPFFTTFGKQGGTGMGTVIMRHVIQMHGGELFVDSEKGRGTSVTFRLPLRVSAQQPAVGADGEKVK